MFFNSIIEINRLRNEINRLLSKKMWNIYLKVTIEEKNWRSQNFDFLGLKRKIALKKQSSGSELWLFCNFNFEMNYDVLKSKSSCIW